MKIDIIPKPKYIRAKSTEIMVKYAAEIYGEENNFQEIIAAFKNYLYNLHGIELKDGRNGICLHKESFTEREAYRIECNATQIDVYVNTVEGLRNAFSTLLQLIEKKGTGIGIPCVDIVDRPSNKIRWFMLELSARYHSVELICHYIDLCVFFKLNGIHLHFTDNMGYTLPSKSYPKLTTKERFYTCDEIAYIVNYAKIRGIDIIPELDLPAHTKPFADAYGEIFGEFQDNLRASEVVFQSLKTLIQELVELFPNSKYIHIGGDEVKTQYWLNDQDTLEYMKEMKIDNLSDLYCHYIGRLAQIVLDMGRIPVIWEGFPRSGNSYIPRESLIIAWECYYQMPDELLADGFKIISSSVKPLYIVHKHWGAEFTLSWRLNEWYNWFKESKAYPEGGYIIAESENNLGGLMCAWGLLFEKDEREAIKEEYALVCDRLPAYAEAIWNSDRMYYNEYLESMKKLDVLLDKLSETRDAFWIGCRGEEKNISLAVDNEGQELGEWNLANQNEKQ